MYKCCGFVLLLAASVAVAFSPRSTGRPTSFDSTTQLLASSTTTPIVNCHVHLYTMDAVPPEWPHKAVKLLRRYGFLRRLAILIAPIVIPWDNDDKVERYSKLLKHAGQKTQEANFDILQKRYPPNTKFVVLPMDLRALDQDPPPPQTIEEQHRELASLAKQHPNKIIPFIHIDPRSASMNGPDALAFTKRLHQTGLNGVKFKGIKLYPCLGYHLEDHCVEPILKYADKHKLPLIVHCMSKGGVWNTKQTSKAVLKQYTAPHSYVRILKKYPHLRLCLAHSGGNHEWDRYLAPHPDNYNNLSPKMAMDYFENDKEFKKLDWVSQIVTMLKSGKFPNLYVDTSYTFFDTKYMKDLKRLLDDSSSIHSRVLFGSDYYLSEQEELSEAKLIQSFENGIGKGLFRQIAVVNAKEFLYGK